MQDIYKQNICKFLEFVILIKWDDQIQSLYNLKWVNNFSDGLFVWKNQSSSI